MGMFDTFYFHGNVLKCANGHAIKSLQTKDLDCVMTIYHVFDGKIFENDRDGGGWDHAPAVTVNKYEVTGNMLKETITNLYRQSDLKEEVVYVYTHCEECDPVVTESDSSLFGNVNTHQPWCEWAIHVKGGEVLEMRPERLQTREELAKELAKNQIVLPDEDRVAKKTIAQHKSKR